MLFPHLVVDPFLSGVFVLNSLVVQAIPFQTVMVETAGACHTVFLELSDRIIDTAAQNKPKLIARSNSDGMSTRHTCNNGRWIQTHDVNVGNG